MRVINTYIVIVNNQPCILFQTSQGWYLQSNKDSHLEVSAYFNGDKSRGRYTKPELIKISTEYAGELINL